MLLSKDGEDHDSRLIGDRFEEALRKARQTARGGRGTTTADAAETTAAGGRTGQEAERECDGSCLCKECMVDLRFEVMRAQREESGRGTQGDRAKGTGAGADAGARQRAGARTGEENVFLARERRRLDELVETRETIWNGWALCTRTRSAPDGSA